MSDNNDKQRKSIAERLHFEPSTIENIDKSVLSYLAELNLFADTNEGWKKVPVIWGTAERAYQVKHNKEIRDQQGLLKFPIITVKRNSIVKDKLSPGAFQGNIPEDNDEQGGALEVSRAIYQEKTVAFASAEAQRLFGQRNWPYANPKIVYRTISAPMPVNVTVTYEITIRTEYQQQMNNLLLPFITMPGTINYVSLEDAGHRYEGFIEGNFNEQDNMANFTSEERKFETKITLKVVGYLVGQEKNRKKTAYSIRENLVEVKIPRERITLGEIPDHELRSYPLPANVSDVFTSIFDVDPFFFSRTSPPGAAQGSSGGSSGVSDSSNYVTINNFSSVLAANIIIRETIKLDGVVPADPNIFTLNYTPRSNTESVFVNGLIQAVGASNDYTISGNTITFTYDIEEADSVYVTYIKS